MKKRLMGLLLAAALLLGLLPGFASAAEPEPGNKPHTVTHVETEMTFWGWTRYITYELDGYEVNSLYAGPEYNTWAFLCMEPQDQRKVARWYLPGEDRTEQFGLTGVELLCKTANDAGGWTQAWEVMVRRLERKFLPDLEPIYGDAHYGETVARLTGTEGEPALSEALNTYGMAPETQAIRESRTVIYGLLDRGRHAYSCCLKALQTAQAAGTKGAAAWTVQFICDNFIYPGMPNIVITAESAVAQAGEAASDLVKQGYKAMLDSTAGLSSRSKQLLSLEGGLGLLLGERGAYQNLILGEGADLKEARDAVQLYRKLADSSYELAKTCYREAEQLRKACVQQAPRAVELAAIREQKETEEFVRWEAEREDTVAAGKQAMEQWFLAIGPDPAVLEQIEAEENIQAQQELAFTLQKQFFVELEQILKVSAQAVDQVLINNEILPRPPEDVDAFHWAKEQELNVRSGDEYYLYAARHPRQQLAAMEAICLAAPELLNQLKENVRPVAAKLQATWTGTLIERPRAIDMLNRAWKDIDTLEILWTDTCKGHYRDFFEMELVLEGPRSRDAAEQERGFRDYYEELTAHEAALQDQFRAARALCEQCTKDLLQEIGELPESLKQDQIVRQDHLTKIPFEEAYERGLRRGKALGLEGRAAADLGYLEQRKVLRQAGEALGTHYEKIMDLGKRLKMAYNGAHSLYQIHRNLDVQLLQTNNVNLKGYDPNFWKDPENAAYAEEFSLKDLVLIPGWEQREVRNFRRYLSQMLGCGRENLSIAAELGALKTAMPEIRRGIRDGTLTAEQVQRTYLQNLEDKINRRYQDGYDSFDPVGLNSGLDRDTSLQVEYETLKAELNRFLNAGSDGYVPATGLQMTDTVLLADENLACGGTLRRTVTVEPQNATFRDLIWSTSDDQIAAVSPDGTITGVSDGVAEVMVRAADSVVTMDPATGEKTYDPAPLTFTVQVGGGGQPRQEPSVELESVGGQYLSWEQSGSLLTAAVTVARCELAAPPQLEILDSQGNILAAAVPDQAQEVRLSVETELPEDLAGPVTIRLALPGAEPILTASVPVRPAPQPHVLTVTGGSLSDQGQPVDLSLVLPGTRVLLQAAPGGENQEFAGWTCDGGSFQNPALPTAVFIMPAGDAAVRASWREHVHTPGPGWFTGRDKDGESAALHWKLCTGCGRRVELGLHDFGPWVGNRRQCRICGFTEQKSWGDEEKKPELWGTPLGDSLRLQWAPYAMDDGEINCHSYVLRLYAGEDLLEERTLPPETRTQVLDPVGSCTHVTLAQNIQYSSGEVRHGREAAFYLEGGRRPVTAYADETTPGRLLVENTLQRFWYDQADLAVELVLACYDETGRLLQVQVQPEQLKTMAVLPLEVPKLPQGAAVQLLVLDPQTHIPIQEAQRLNWTP